MQKHKKTIKSTLVLIGWATVLWFFATGYSRDADLLHHPIEFIFLFFIINIFGIGFYEAVNEPTGKEKIENSKRIIQETEDQMYRDGMRYLDKVMGNKEKK